MKKLFCILTAITTLLCLCACTPEPYSGDPIAPTAAGDTLPWPTDTFFADAPHIAASVSSITPSQDGYNCAIKISDISYADFVKWTKAMKESGVQPVGSGEYGLDGAPIDGLASFNGETRTYIVLSTWSENTASGNLTVSFIKKR